MVRKRVTDDASGRELGRAALTEVAPGEVGRYLRSHSEAPGTVTFRFDALQPGYRGWEWAVVVAMAPGSSGPTVSEIGLLPGPEAVLAPAWVPWEERIQPGDLSPGDLLPVSPEDPRLETDGDGTVRLTAPGAKAARGRWRNGPFGPRSEFAAAAENLCGTCGFLVAIEGRMGRDFGVCANEFSADGRVVHREFGCGAHSATEIPVPELVGPKPEFFDDGSVEWEPWEVWDSAEVKERGGMADEVGRPALEAQPR